VTKKGKQAKARMMYKILNGIGPKSLINLFTYKEEIIEWSLSATTTHVIRELGKLILVVHSKENFC
jgi:hypothetical protein